MTHRKKLIEVALPLEAINAASAREKSIRHGHPSTLHLWWARRPLAAARAVIFTSLVDDPDSPDAPPAFVAACRALDGNQFDYDNKNAAAEDTPRMRLFDFIEKLVTWEATTDEKVLDKARELIRLSTDDNPPPLLDPFAGGGSIPLEAQRLGLEAHASDLNPVAVMINKAQIEIPPRFAGQPPVNPDDSAKDTGGDAEWRGASGLAADVRYYGEWMRERAWERIGHLYPTHNGETVIAWLWARTVKSPNPAVNAHVPLVRSFQLSKKKGREKWAKPVIEGNQVRFEITPGKPPKGEDGTYNRSGGTCIVSGTPITRDYLYQEGQAGRMGAQLMAIVTEGQSGRSYYSPDEKHVQIAAKAKPQWEPSGQMPDNPRWFSPPGYGMTHYADLFTPRQLTALTTFSDLVGAAREQIHADALAAGLRDDDTPLRDGGTGARAYAEAVSVYLAFGVDRLADRQSNICTWDSGYVKIRNVFSRQAIPMTWDYVEGNPFSDSTGNFADLLMWVWKSIETNSNATSGYVSQMDAPHVDVNGNFLISTDPPYYDNIGYSDLSDFFYVWLRRPLRDIYPDIFGTMLVPKAPELVASPYRFNGDSQKADRHFEVGLHQTFVNARSFSDHAYPLSVYYAFKQQEIAVAGEQVSSTGWEKMLSSLMNAGFSLNGTWPVRTEMSNRSIASGTNALASSIVLVCRPRPADAPRISRREFVSLLRQELPAALKEMQSGNIAPVDLAQASIGPGMAVYSRYSQVMEADGTPLTVRKALQIINQELDAYLSEQEGHIDADSRFAVAWFEQNGFDAGEFGVADVLARAKNTSVNGIESAGIIESGHGRVRLLPVHELYELTPDWDPNDDRRATIWEAVHHLIARLQRHGEVGSAMLMERMPGDMGASARALAYRLYSICERKGWADHARDYNALVVQWSDIQSTVASRQAAAARGDATEQLDLFDEE